MENVIESLELLGPFICRHIPGILHHHDHAPVSGRIRTDRTQICVRQRTAFPAVMDSGTGIHKDFGHILHVLQGHLYNTVSYTHLDVYKRQYQYSRTLNQQTYSYDYNITAFKAEEALTSAIQYVTSQNTPVLYMLTGHGEENLTENMQNLLKKANFDVQEFSLTGTQELAANEYTIVLINNPTSDITELEYNDLQAYMDAGGRMMFNVEYSYPENMTYFDKLLDVYKRQVQRLYAVRPELSGSGD